jgi:hypothetical protein
MSRDRRRGGGRPQRLTVIARPQGERTTMRSYASVVATLALFVALGGTAAAVTP